MKGRIVILGPLRGVPAAALMEDGRLVDLLVDADSASPLPGAILRAVADRPMKGQGGMFVKLPGGSGFLRQTSGIVPGESLLVQVTGPAEHGKAVPVTTRLLFRSRYAILTPGAPGRNISRRIKAVEMRAALEALAEAGMAGADESLGLILRSACENGAHADIAADIAATRDLAERVLADRAGRPEVLLDAPSAEEAAWRDWADPLPDAVEDGPDAMPDHGVEEALAALLSPRAAFPGGGHMMIEPTHAMVCVDVNTGPDTSPAAGLKANIAAARDLPRLLRLRGLGGQVVVDFAPVPKRDRAVIEQTLRAAFKGEAAETSLVGWTTMGLYELVRKRDRIALSEIFG